MKEIIKKYFKQLFCFHRWEISTPISDKCRKCGKFGKHHHVTKVERVEWMDGTNKFIKGEEIMIKRHRYDTVCIRCKETVSYGDTTNY